MSKVHYIEIIRENKNAYVNVSAIKGILQEVIKSRDKTKRLEHLLSILKGVSND